MLFLGFWGGNLHKFDGYKRPFKGHIRKTTKCCFLINSNECMITLLIMAQTLSWTCFIATRQNSIYAYFNGNHCFSTNQYEPLINQPRIFKLCIELKKFFVVNIFKFKTKSQFCCVIRKAIANFLFLNYSTKWVHSCSLFLNNERGWTHSAECKVCCWINCWKLQHITVNSYEDIFARFRVFLYEANLKEKTV